MWFSKILDQNNLMLEIDMPYIKTSDIEFIIQDSNYSIKQYRNNVIKAVEWKRAIPLINVSFHYHIFRDENVPTPEEFLQDYERDNQSFLSLMPQDLIPGIQYRVMRAYPSLIRDAHFVSKSREMGYETIRTLQLDLHGIDAMILLEFKTLLVRLYYDSKRSNQYKNAKATSHQLQNCIDLGLNKRNSTKVGNILLYSEETIQNMIDENKQVNEEENVKIDEKLEENHSYENYSITA